MADELPRTVGRYRVLGLLGEGSMGRVLLAHDPVLEREVALKHLRTDLAIDAHARASLEERMRHEAQAAARVAHPNLVVLHDMGEDAAVGLFLVFERVEGPTLRQRIADEGRLAPAQAARLARELGAALTVTHEAGILHRDVKPENVMLARTGAKIADFGIARIPGSTLTHKGGLVGTPAYGAPETARGGKHSPSSDQFSLAATLFEAISGKRAFPGDDAVVVAARIAKGPPAPMAGALGLPVAVDAVFARALAVRPDERFPDCEAFGEAMARCLVLPSAAELSSAPGVGSALPAAAPPPPPRKTSQVLLGAVIVLATAALLARAAFRSMEAAASGGPGIDARLDAGPHPEK